MEVAMLRCMRLNDGETNMLYAPASLAARYCCADIVDIVVTCIWRAAIMVY